MSAPRLNEDNSLFKSFDEDENHNYLHEENYCLQLSQSIKFKNQNFEQADQDKLVVKIEHQMTSEEKFIKYAEKFNYFLNLNDDYKTPLAYKHGGFVLND